jgi:hypothetical protein
VDLRVLGDQPAHQAEEVSTLVVAGHEPKYATIPRTEDCIRPATFAIMPPQMDGPAPVVSLVGHVYTTWGSSGETRRCLATEHDGCVVETAPIARCVREYEREQKRKRPWNRASLDPAVRNGVAPYAPLDALAHDAGLPVTVVRNVTMARTYPTTELRVADALTAALDAEHLMYDGSLTISANPRATPAARRECCGTHHC